MKLNAADADIFIPDGSSLQKALDRTTHLGIGAHADDLEVLAFHGIIAGYDNPHGWFSGITCTNGSGSPRKGDFAGLSDDRLAEIRKAEQKKAAGIGKYSAVIQLGYASKHIKSVSFSSLVDDIGLIIKTARPNTLYTHNPFDKHDTHRAVCLAVVKAVRRLPSSIKPKTVLGCEVWRDLDWLPAERKVVLDVSGHENLESELLSVFVSQTKGGKRYDVAVSGRRRAQATFLDSHLPDRLTSAVYALDLTPVVVDNSMDIKTFLGDIMNEFRKTVEGENERLIRLLDE